MTSPKTHIGDKIRLLGATAFGFGLSPVMPGTCGTVPGVAIHVLIVLTLPAKFQWASLVAVFLLACVGNLALAPWAIRYWKSKDPKHFVLDEVAGYLVIPILFTQGSLWKVALWGFFLFRIFDIIKTPPASYFDKNVSGGWGILLDDIVAGLYAVLVIYMIFRIKPDLIL